MATWIVLYNFCIMHKEKFNIDKTKNAMKETELLSQSTFGFKIDIYKIVEQVIREMKQFNCSKVSTNEMEERELDENFEKEEKKAY